MKSLLKLIYEFLIDLILIIYHTIKSLTTCLIPIRYRKKSIENNIVLITGGGSGIGRGLAIRFAKCGAIVVIWDINKSGMNQTQEEIESFGGSVFSFYCDITDCKSVYKTATEVRKIVGNVNILVNNAGVVSGKQLLQIPDDKIVQTFNVNVISHFWLIKAFLRKMIETNSGHLVSIASIAGVSGVPGLTDYCASKYAAIGLGESLRLELLNNGMDGIKSTIVCPYYINTGLFKGVNTRIFPLLDTENVCDQIIDAVLTDSNYLFIPKIFNGLIFLKSCLPNDALNILYNYFGVNNMISNHFEGRSDDFYDRNRNFIDIESKTIN